MTSNNWLKNWFLFCSGAHLDFLNHEDCKYEHNKYIGIGSAVFFTALFAFMSASYALYTVFGSWWSACFIGFVWSCFIFSLDRYIVSTLKKDDNKLNEIWKASPRILLAIMLAIIISKPLELRIFEREIENELIKMQNEVEKQQNEAVYSKYPEVENLETAINRLDIDFKSCQNYADKLEADAAGEADGSAGSGIRNIGPIYKIKRQNADAKKVECNRILQELDKSKSDLATLKSKIDLEVTNLARTKENGLLARIEALSRLTFTKKIVENKPIVQNKLEIKKDSTGKIDSLQMPINQISTSQVTVTEERNAMYWATLAITILFVIIELAPLLLKIFTDKGNYDLKVQTIEETVKSREIEEISYLNDEVNTRVKIKVGINENIVNRELQDNKNLMEKISNAQLDLAKEIIDIWKGDELIKIRENPKKYVGNLKTETNEEAT
ncbi:DUF4407 domain-containing protein [Runella limosa]|uniref:DUF4407 domain-containing protein n=1 Tax=Runella limosa TaxID=370978 RepID=UPI0004161087|nr:DUF4407 domain-containing protein [Runella limosa]